ncbi:oxidation resistance protein 1 [Clydaea vesicula]|uniref:Oxidation resistance protein 1 n=1 Tax=Clydaea vesicula TaxID=447962 RepID=A0AAD5U7Z7_9FUNG|nr:oxidation resistance protein 1 [Clydaea vesicula]
MNLHPEQHLKKTAKSKRFENSNHEYSNNKDIKLENSYIFDGILNFNPSKEIPVSSSVELPTQEFYEKKTDLSKSKSPQLGFFSRLLNQLNFSDESESESEHEFENQYEHIDRNEVDHVMDSIKDTNPSKKDEKIEGTKPLYDSVKSLEKSEEHPSQDNISVNSNSLSYQENFPDSLSDFFWDLFGLKHSAIKNLNKVNNDTPVNTPISNNLFEINDDQCWDSIKKKRKIIKFQGYENENKKSTSFFSPEKENSTYVDAYLKTENGADFCENVSKLEKLEFLRQQTSSGKDDRQGKVLEENSLQEGIMFQNLAQDLLPNLPPLYQEALTWNLVYSIEKHGVSLKTLYSRCFDAGPCLLLIKDDKGNTFGAFSNQEFAVNVGYFGNGLCFLWKWDVKKKKIEVFKATGANEYLVLCETHFIAFGGGEGKFGLWIDEDLLNGYSGHCQTFNNPDLSLVDIDDEDMKEIEGEKNSTDVKSIEIDGSVTNSKVKNNIEDELVDVTTTSHGRLNVDEQITARNGRKTSVDVGRFEIAQLEIWNFII